MKYRLVILPRAGADICRNAEWWAQHHSSEQAARWLDTVQTQLESIVVFPESHGLSPENGEFPYEIRDKLLGLGARPGFRAVFTIRDSTVYVLAVRRGAEGTLQLDDVEPLPSN